LRIENGELRGRELRIENGELRGRELRIENGELSFFTVYLVKYEKRKSGQRQVF
jgi:hypothetical protein